MGKHSYGMRMTGLLTVLVIVFNLAVMPVAAQKEAEDLTLYAGAAVLMDADSGRVLYEKNGKEKMPMASTTKIMTCIVALENGNLNDTVTASAYAASQPKVHLGMRKGRQYRLEDLLYSLMLESHNDSAVAIAEHIGGAHLKMAETAQRSKEESQKAVAAFIGMMNQKARDIGCFDTFFITPNGLDAEMTDAEGKSRIHSTTAADLANIMRYCIGQSTHSEQFLAITRTASYSFGDLESKQQHSCTNHNAFLQMMDGALSGKTGFTNGAGYCYVGALEQNGKRFTVALLACGWPNHKTWKWQDTRQLMQYGLDQYEFCSFETPQEALSFQKIAVENAQTERIGQEAFVQVELTSQPYGLLMKKEEQIEIRLEKEELLTAPVTIGTKVGSVSYLVDGRVWKIDEIRTVQEAEAIDYQWCFLMVVKYFLLKS